MPPPNLGAVGESAWMRRQRRSRPVGRRDHVDGVGHCPSSGVAVGYLRKAASQQRRIRQPCQARPPITATTLMFLYLVSLWDTTFNCGTLRRTKRDSNARNAPGTIKTAGLPLPVRAFPWLVPPVAAALPPGPARNRLRRPFGLHCLHQNLLQLRVERDQLKFISIPEYLMDI